jgi:STE24 endopeptidase
VIEQRYGFNKSTLKLWISDKIKEFVIGLIIGIPLLSLILWLFGVFDKTWWIWAFGAVAVFQILMLVLYPRLILPLFNKLSPIEDGELKDRLIAMSDRAGFKANAIFVMDGSKRSSHSNAFFTGFGKFRRIVLYDTLISQLSISELEAVLAHEIGHYKLGHVPKMIASSFVMMFFGFAAIAWLARSPWFYEGFGFSPDTGMAPALLLFSVLVPLFTFWLHPVFNAVSRRYEYQADAFAKQVCGGGEDLVASLRKLHTKNLGNLTPHKIYSAFHYSHPTLLEREAALNAKD